MPNDPRPPGSDSAPLHLDLSKIRHDLRTPINHILGYCEMLQEEDTPPDFLADLSKIHAGGKQLMSLIAEYFDEETFEAKHIDLHLLCHELRTPVNHIVGYTELLEELAEERGLKAVFSDLDKIREAARIWLELMEEYLVFPQVRAAQNALAVVPVPVRPALLQPGIGFSAPIAHTTFARLSQESHVLVVDDDVSNRDMLSRRLARFGCRVSVAATGLEALKSLRTSDIDLVLLDMVMPGLDGYQVLSKIKTDPLLADIPVIMISALDQESSVARCLEAGAEDYVPKPFNSVLLRARIGASLEKRHLRETERRTHEALVRSQQHLAAELAEAAGYIKSLLPPPLSGLVEAEWCFQPSAQLGGDTFGYHWLDHDHLAVYLVDVCGHGVGAALLSISVLNALRSQTLGGADFTKPASVLGALNRTFPMDKQNNLFFSAWYGVYRPSQRTLNFCGGGHPPALLLEPCPAGTAQVIALQTEAPAVGCFDQAQYAASSHSIAPGCRLLVFTDGVYEIFDGATKAGTWQEFFESFQNPAVQALRPHERLLQARRHRGAEFLEDDFSLIDLRFP